MDIQINEVDTQLRVSDPRSLLSPQVMALIVAEVRRQLENHDQLEAQRRAERDPHGRGGDAWKR